MLLEILLSLTQTLADDSKFESRISPTAVAYASMDAAAVAALRVATMKSNKMEFGGCVFRIENRYFFTDPVMGERDNFKAICIGRGSGEFVALYHTHPQGSIPGVSGHDIEIATRLKKTSYVAFIDQNSVVKFVPGKTRTECLSGFTCSSRQQTSQGEIVESRLLP